MSNISELAEPIRPSLEVGKEKPKKAAAVSTGQHVHRYGELTYSPHCEECRADDEKRRGKAVYADQLAHTLFFIPNISPEQDICASFIQTQYKGKATSTNTINWLKLLARPEVQIVVVRRFMGLYEETSAPYKEVPTTIPGNVRIQPLPAKDFHPEVLESQPILVGKYLQNGSNSLTDGLENVNLVPLVTALQEIAGPSYQIVLANVWDPRTDTKIIFSKS